MELWEIAVFCLAVSQIGVLFTLMKLQKKVKDLDARTTPAPAAPEVKND